MAGITLYFISETVPGNTHASSVTFYRHFKALEAEGYRIVWVTDQNSYNDFSLHFPKEWGVFLLPNRRWHLPPYRPAGLFQAYRFRYYARLFMKQLPAGTNARNCLLVTYINGQFLAPFSAYLKKKCRLPLLSFFHDDVLELNRYEDERPVIVNTGKVLGASDRVCVVSDEFRTNWGKYQSKFRLLYPIPGKYPLNTGHREPEDVITFGYSGAIYDELLPCLAAAAAIFKTLGHVLIVVGNNPGAGELQKNFPGTVYCFDLFETPEEANAFLTGRCQAALIPYPEESAKMPWVATCFPSKFLQYCQLGLPALIIAPADSALGKWCDRHHWPLYTGHYDAGELAALIGKIGTLPVRNKVNHLRENDFNPDKIHHLLTQIIQEIFANPLHHAD